MIRVLVDVDDNNDGKVDTEENQKDDLDNDDDNDGVKYQNEQGKQGERSE